LFDEPADGLERRVVAGFSPFEEDSLAGRDDGAGAFQATEGELPVDRVSTADGVGGDLNDKALREEVEGRLGDADVGLDAGQGHMADAASMQLLEEFGNAAARKAAFLGPVRNPLGDGGDGRPQAAGILLGRQNRKFKSLGGVEQQASILDQFGVSVDVREQPLLNVDQK
jgi:hypothetical protein